jgi:hypothetical protein
MIGMGIIDKNVPVHLQYKHGNVFCVVDLNDLKKEVLLTDETYLFVKEETKVIHSVKIGKPCNPNLLYYKEKLNNIITTIDKAATLPNLNSVWIEPSVNSPLY